MMSDVLETKKDLCNKAHVAAAKLPPHVLNFSAENDKSRIMDPRVYVPKLSPTFGAQTVTANQMAN
jgi:hypothetical protein